MSEAIQDVGTGRGRSRMTPSATVRAASFDRFESLRKKEAARPSRNANATNAAKSNANEAVIHLTPQATVQTDLYAKSPALAQRSSVGGRSPGAAPAPALMAAASRGAGAPRSRL